MPKEIDYTVELAVKICDLISESQVGLKTLCKQNDWMPSSSTVKKWIRQDRKENESDNEGFATLYARAKEEQADALVEEMLDIADNKTEDKIATEYGESGNSVAVARDKLRIDTRKFIAAKLRPKKYGDKLDLGGTVEQIIKVRVQGENDSELDKTEY